MQREKVLEYLKEYDSITSKELITILGLESTQARKILRDMAKDGILIAQGIFPENFPYPIRARFGLSPD